MAETILFDVYFEFVVWSNVPSTNTEKAGFMNYTAASQQGGNQDTLASLLGGCHVVYLYLQFMVETWENMADYEEEEDKKLISRWLKHKDS